MKTKSALLSMAALAFKHELMQAKGRDSSLEPVVQYLTPLFDAIQAGQIQPPYLGGYKLQFDFDDPKYGMSSRFCELEAQFRSALEDWPSQPWFIQAQQNQEK